MTSNENKGSKLHGVRVHNCRAERVKYRLRDSSKDVSLLTEWLDKAKLSMNLIYPQYLAERNHKISQDVKDQQSSADHFDETSTEKSTNSKVIRERKLNNNDINYGDLIWPQGITCTYRGEILCTDSHEHRILAFNSDFIFKYKFGEHGSGNGQFDEPVDLVINQLGKLYIADKNNYRIQVYYESRVRPSRASVIIVGRRSRSQSLKPYPAGFAYSASISLNDKPVRLVSSALASITACSTQNGFIYVLNLANQVVYFLKMKTQYAAASIRNICLNSNGNELIYLSPNRNNELYLRFYAIDEKEANSFDRTGTEIKRLELARKIKLEQEYLPGISLSRIGQIRIGLDLESLVIFDVSNLNLLQFDMNGRFKDILLKAEDYLGNVLAFTFSSDQLHLVAVECDVNRNFPCLLANRNNNSAFNFKIKSYKVINCDCHKNMVNKKSIYVDRERTMDFMNFTQSMDLFN